MEDKENRIAEAATAEKSAGKKQTAAKKTEKTGGYCVYLGPGIRGVIAQGLVVKGTKAQASEKLREKIEVYPEIAELLVPKEQVPAAARKLRNGDCALARAAHAVEHRVEKGEKLG